MRRGEEGPGGRAARMRIVKPERRGDGQGNDGPGRADEQREDASDELRGGEHTDVDALPPGEDGAESAVHADGGQIGGDGGADGETGGGDGAGERDVFDEGGPDAGMSADGFVDGAADEEELAVGEGAAAGGVARGDPAVPDDDHGAAKWHKQTLPEADAAIAKPEADQIKTMLMRVVNGRAEGVRVEADIGVEEEQPVAASAGSAERAGVRFAQPAGGEHAVVDDVAARVGGGESVGKLRGGVGGAVVDDDQLEKGAALGEHGLRGGGEVVLLVPGGEDDGDGGGQWGGVGCFIGQRAAGAATGVADGGEAGGPGENNGDLCGAGEQEERGHSMNPCAR